MSFGTARGYVLEGWDKIDPYHMLGAKPAEALPSTPGHSPLSAATASQLDRHGNKPWHPDSPLFWFGILAATTLGLIGASTSVRLGPFKGALSAGTT